MREIKFRAWDTATNKIVTDVDPLQWQREWNMPVMQFTGLKDKNGKEIYEGDILAVYLDDKPYKKEVVEWIGGTMDFQGFPFCGCDVFEVIGNIYENPELLREIKDNK